MSNEVRTQTSDTQGAAGATVTAAAFTTQAAAGKAVTLRQKRMLGWGLLILAFLLGYLLLVFWPEELGKDDTGSTRQTIYLVGDLIKFQMRVDVRLILLVMMAGGLGSFVHTATSFSDYVGNEKLTANWLWWYVQRPFIGMMLAVVFYLAIRGGFLTGGGDVGSINPFGIAALAGLVGMFSKQATDKLSEVFDTLFKTSPGSGDSKRKDDLHNPVPVLTDVEPRNVTVKTENVLVTVKGSGFVKGSSVRVNDVARETHYAEATQLTAKLLPEDVDKEGELTVTVFNPGPGGGTSTPIKVKIASGNTPTPTPTPTPAEGVASGNGNVPPADTEVVAEGDEVVSEEGEGEEEAAVTEDAGVAGSESGVRPDNPDS